MEQQDDHFGRKFHSALDLIGSVGGRDPGVYPCYETGVIVWIATVVRDDQWAVAAGFHPLEAVLRLCSELIDGPCVHCGKPAAFMESAGPLPLEDLACWTQWEPDGQRFRRGCG